MGLQNLKKVTSHDVTASVLGVIYWVYRLALIIPVHVAYS